MESFTFQLIMIWNFVPTVFSSLKRNVVRHDHSSKSHTDAIAEIEERKQKESELKSKYVVAGLNLGRLCVKNYLLGRPYTDYQSDVFVLKKGGAVVGELNHSRKFPAAFRPFVVKVVHGRVKKYLQTPLKQTGHLPPVGISADKGTYKHRSRQFLSCVTVIPGGNNWPEILTFGKPVVTKGSTGMGLAENMKTGYDYVGLVAKQIESGVFDGVYFPC